MRLAATALLGLACLGACTLVPPPRSVERYDFGPASARTESPARIRQPVLVADIAAPAWLETTAIRYRLLYADAAQTRSYANSQWAAPPAALLTVRLRQQLAAVSSAAVLAPGDAARSAATLRVDLLEFSQVFDAPESSRALVTMRATLVGARGTATQRTFQVERVASSADAPGGVRALGLAGDAAIEQIVDWAAAQLQKD